MNEKIINSKFILLMLLSLIAVALSLGCWLFVGLHIVSVLVNCVSLLFLVVFLYIEPIFYIIKEREIWIFTFFNKYCILYNQIESITIRSDLFFEFLFVEDYILNLNGQIRIPKRSKRILKCAGTKNIELFYGNKIVKF